MSKKIIIAILSIIFIILIGFQIQVEATSFSSYDSFVNSSSKKRNDKIKMNLDDYAEEDLYVDVRIDPLVNNGLYCIQHNQNLFSSSEKKYNVYNVLKISGRTMTAYSFNDKKEISADQWYNAKLGYIVNQDNTNYFFTKKRYYPSHGGSQKACGPVSNAIWRTMGTWVRKSGKPLFGMRTSITSMAYRGKDDGYTYWDDNHNLVEGVPADERAAETELLNAANAYADNVAKSISETKKTITKSMQYVNGSYYIRVGPFQYTFPSTLSAINVRNQNESNIAGLLYSYYNGSSQVFCNSNQVPDNKEFYVFIPINSNTRSLTTTEVKSNVIYKNATLYLLDIGERKFMAKFNACREAKRYNSRKK